MNKLLVFVFLPILFFVSCAKEDYYFTGEIEEDTAKEVNSAESFFKMIYQISRQETEYAEKEKEFNLYKTGIISIIDSCAHIEYHADTIGQYISSLTITYPDTACYSSGKVKKGKLKVFITGKLNSIGTIMTIIPENFYVNSKKVEGTIKATNLTFTSDSILLVENEIQNGKIWMTTSKFFTWDSEGVIELDFLNDVLFCTNESNAINQNGLGYTVSTIDRLKSDFSCDYFQSGELQITANWGFTQKINYGNGACDDKADLWEGGKSIEILLD